MAFGDWTKVLFKVELLHKRDSNSSSFLETSLQIAQAPETELLFKNNK